MKDIVNTLLKLANAANSQANTLIKKKDPASQTQAKALYAKQAQLAFVGKQLEEMGNALNQFEEIGDYPLNPLFDGMIKKVRRQLAPLAEVRHPDPKLLSALNNPKLSQDAVLLDQALKGLKRNLELRQTAAQHLLESKETDEAILKQKRMAYAKRVKEDAALRDLLKNPQHFIVELDKANKQWAKVLEETFNIKNLPENRQVPAPAANPFANLLSTFMNGLSDLFKGLVTSDGSENGFKKPMMAFMGKMIPAVIGLFTGIFKKFFGGSSAQNDTKAEELNKNITEFFTKQMNKEPEPKEFTPMKRNLMSSALSLSRMAKPEAPTPVAKPPKVQPKPTTNVQRATQRYQAAQMRAAQASARWQAAVAAVAADNKAKRKRITMS